MEVDGRLEVMKQLYDRLQLLTNSRTQIMLDIGIVDHRLGGLEAERKALGETLTRINSQIAVVVREITLKGVGEKRDVFGGCQDKEPGASKG